MTTLLAETSCIIFLSDGSSCLIDAEDYERLSKYKWNNSNGRAVTTVKRKHIHMSRLIMDPPKDKVVDHINSNPLDNRRSNLRIVTQSHNLLNRSKSAGKASEFLGVSWHSGNNSWLCRATSAISGKRYTLGYYNTEVEAAQAYNYFCAKYNPFSKLNII